MATLDPKADIDAVLDFIAEQTPLILESHARLGLSLETLLCAAVRRRLEFPVAPSRVLSTATRPGEMPNG
jgi:hypothetical protein